MRYLVTGLTVALIVAGLWGSDSLAKAQTGCASQGAVQPSETALAADCEVLLDVRDTLAGTASLNWAAGTPIEDWEGVSVGGTPTRVVGISLVNRGLTGTIPGELGNLSGLTYLDLSFNQLAGTIPSELSNLSKLTGLDLGGNELTGTIPSELGGLSNLTALNLSRNQLSGTIPGELGSLSNLRYLWLSQNELRGDIPVSLTGLTSLEGLVFFSNAGLCAPVDSAFQAWLKGVGSVHGSSCAPVDSQQDRAVLAKLYNATGGAKWEGNSNWLSNRPIREWYGVANDADGRVTGLYLWENQLSGTIPSELGGLSNLKWMYLDNNLLTGSIPPELGNLPNLVALFLHNNQLSGCIPVALQSVVSNDLDELGLPFCGIPTVVITVDSANYRVRINSPIPVTATFSEPINSFTAGDIAVASGAVSNFVGSDGDSVYTFDVTPNAVGVVTVDIAAGVAEDSDGNGNTAAVQLTLGLPYDDDHDGAISREEVITAIGDYLFGGLLTRDEVIQIIGLYLFG